MVLSAFACGRLLARLRNEILVQQTFKYQSNGLNPEEVAIVGEVSLSLPAPARPQLFVACFASFMISLLFPMRLLAVWS